MKKIKILLRAILIMVFIGFSSNSTLAENTLPSTPSQNMNISMASVAVEKVTVNKNTFNAGEEISGSFTVTNYGEVSTPGLVFRVLVGSKYEEMGPDMKVTNTFLDASQLNSVGDLRAGESKKVNFKYKTPQFIGGEKLAIQINVYSANALILNQNSSQYISIKKTGDSVSVSNAKLILGNGKEYNLTIGPTIYKDKDPKSASLSIQVKNESKAEITINPLLNVYNQHKKEIKLSNKQESVKLKVGESKKLLIELPVFEYTPAVYFAEVLLNDEKGNQLATRIGVRYIVAGNIANLHSIDSDKQQVKSGEEFTLNYIVSGRPFDIEIREQMVKDKNLPKPEGLESDIGRLNINIFNQFGELVANHTEEFNLFQEKIGSKKLKAITGAKAMKAVVSIFNGNGVSLLEKEVMLSDDFDRIAKAEIFKRKTLFGGVILFLIIILIIAFVMFRRKKVGSVTLAMITLVSSIVIPSSVGAWVWTGTNVSGCASWALSYGGAPSLSISSPYDNYTYVEGSTIYLSGYATYYVCSNSPTHLQLSFYNNSNGESGNRAIDSNSISGGHYTWYETVWFSSRALNVGTRPGLYNVSFYVSDGCFYVNGYVPYRVRCSAGRSPNASGYCAPTPIPVSGSCGSANGITYQSYETPSTSYCATGTYSNSASLPTANGFVFSWQCAGSNGGSTASCSYTKITTGNTASCGSANGVGSVNTPSSNLCSSGTASSVTTVSGNWAWTCSGSTTGDVVSCGATKNNGEITTGGTSGTGGCLSGTYFCELLNQCVPLDKTCNTALLEEYFQLNPNIKADRIGDVSLKGLFSSPSIGNPGYSCIIDWSDGVFASYDYLTRCTFTTPTTTIEFSPGSTTAPTSYKVDNVTKDMLFRMSCTEVDSSTIYSKEATCRVNWNYQEIN